VADSKTDSKTDIDTIRDFIRRERAMRVAVFRETAKRQAKTADCDNALAALSRLEVTLCKAEDLGNSLQPGLFDERAAQ
jgi:hypothetical protein